MGFPGGASGKKPACQCRRCKRCRFDPWVWKMPWRRAWKSTPVFLPGEPQGQRRLAAYSPWGRKELSVCTHARIHVAMYVFVLSHVRLLPGSCVRGVLQAKYWSGLPFPIPGDLPGPGIEPMTLLSHELAGRFFTVSVTGKALCGSIARSFLMVRHRDLFSHNITLSESPMLLC